MTHLENVLVRVAAAKLLSEQAQVALARAALQLLFESGTGGISRLVESFQSQGLGHVISSWIGTGHNRPLFPHQVESVLGPERTRMIAARAGLTLEAACAGLAEILPQLIDGLTPSGAIVSGDLISQGLALLDRKALHH